MTILRLSRVVPFVVLLAACGEISGTPSTPSPPQPIQLAGAWTGDLASANFPQQSVALTLTQSGTGIGGKWVSEALGWSGVVAGTVNSDTFSGTFTISVAGITSEICAGMATVAGGVSSTALTWTSPGFTGPCGGLPATVRITAVRR
jgi:hypothetical protein